MRSVRAQIDEPAKKDDPEKTRAQKKKSDWLVNADLKLIGDPTRIEEPSEATLRSLLIGPSDRGVTSFVPRRLIASSVRPRFNGGMPDLTRKCVNDRPETWRVYDAGYWPVSTLSGLFWKPTVALYASGEYNPGAGPTI